MSGRLLAVAGSDSCAVVLVLLVSVIEPLAVEPLVEVVVDSVGVADAGSGAGDSTAADEDTVPSG